MQYRQNEGESFTWKANLYQSHRPTSHSLPREGTSPGGRSFSVQETAKRKMCKENYQYPILVLTALRKH